MLLPIGAAFRPLARSIKFRTLGTGMVTLGAILARARKPRAFVAATVLARFVITGLFETRLVETPRTVARWTRIASDVIGRAGITLLPRL
jgi:hypothetical protein